MEVHSIILVDSLSGEKLCNFDLQSDVLDRYHDLWRLTIRQWNISKCLMPWIVQVVYFISPLTNLSHHSKRTPICHAKSALVTFNTTFGSDWSIAGLAPPSHRGTVFLPSHERLLPWR